MRELAIGDRVPLRGGGVATISRIEGGFVYGSAYNGHIKLEWTLEGRRLPVGGTDPFDLVLKHKK